MHETFDIPFTSGNIWIDIEVQKHKYFELSVMEIYSVAEEFRGVLGATDSRTIFTIGFRIPFV